MIEKLECCPDCSSAEAWNYDMQRCARCGNPQDAAWGVIAEIGRERVRQIVREGFSPGSDDGWTGGELAGAASAYTLSANISIVAGRDGGLPEPPPFFRFARAWWKPRSPREDLIRAAALIVAEIERLDRAAGKGAS